MNPFLRPLFKPILNKAARQAYKMTGTAQEFATGAAQRAKPMQKITWMQQLVIKDDLNKDLH